MVRFLSFSRPNLGQSRVNSRPIKKITIGLAESLIAETNATDGARTNARFLVNSLIILNVKVPRNG